ncbi:MAG: dynamin family protein [Magnetococcales bacterium]|nr:dynamin family protein [Magnetococcales bacterium]
MFDNTNQIERRLQSLEKHLKQENPVLLQVVQSFRELDRVAYRMGLLSREDSFATQVPWWPLISILGTFSSGKSTFINSYLGQKLQRTGNQAVDDKFTVICYAKEDKSHTLPGLALDSDPRFPFYEIGREVEHVVSGEGRRIDSYLQLKTCPTEALRGKIIIDSPGFDADAQRTSILRIVDHIINLSDLVLVFFDARHPEPGAMRDTLEHLVNQTISRHDSNKFLYILNQIDCTAREANLEDVVAAWQRSLAQCGLTAGRFYQIFDNDAANPIDDETVKAHYLARRDEDMADITLRMQRVEVERAYRIIGVLENTAKMITEEVVPKMSELIGRWRKLVLTMDGVLAVIVFILGSAVASSPVMEPVIQGLLGLNWLDPQTWGWKDMLLALGAAAVGTGLVYLHFMARRFARFLVLRTLPAEARKHDLRNLVRSAFLRNTRSVRSLFQKVPSGWSPGTRNRVLRVLKDSDMYVQNLNDQFTNPSGKATNKNSKVQLEVS